MDAERMDKVFEALAHPARRQILDIVKDQPGCSLHDVCDFFEISRIAVMKHLRCLERADLLVSRKQGRTRQLYFNAVPIQMIYDRWTTAYSSLWASGLTRIKYRVEAFRGKQAGAGNREPAAKSTAKRARKAAQPARKKRHA
jgi:DNA-binding transcriptional ArsR family regulator